MRLVTIAALTLKPVGRCSGGGSERGGAVYVLPLIPHDVNHVTVTPLHVAERCKVTVDSVNVSGSAVTFEQCQSANLGRKMEFEGNLED